MSKEELRRRAFEARELYQRGLISRAEAKVAIDPYLSAFNIFSKKTAEKYEVKPKLVSFSTFTRI